MIIYIFEKKFQYSKNKFIFTKSHYIFENNL
jgi:hypothetical protein